MQVPAARRRPRVEADTHRTAERSKGRGAAHSSAVDRRRPVADSGAGPRRGSQQLGQIVFVGSTCTGGRCDEGCTGGDANNIQKHPGHVDLQERLG